MESVEKKQTKENYRVKDEFSFKIEGEEIRVEFNGESYGNYVLHFSFYSKVISTTGYKSHFMFVEEYNYEGYTDYKICAHDIAKHYYKELKANNPEIFAHKDQLAFF
jgi:hypothetical protein